MSDDREELITQGQASPGAEDNHEVDGVTARPNPQFRLPYHESLVVSPVRFAVEVGEQGKHAYELKDMFNGHIYSGDTNDLGVLYTTVNATKSNGKGKFHVRAKVRGEWTHWSEINFDLAEKPTLTSPTPGTLLAPRPTFSGTKDTNPKALVQIGIDDTGFYSLPESSSSSWTYQWTRDLTPGPHTVHVRYYISFDDGGSSLSSYPITVVQSASITSPKMNDVLRELKPEVSGTGPNGTTVTVFRQGGEGGSYGSGPVTNGSWKVRLSKNLPLGSFVFHAETKIGTQRVGWSNLVPVTVLLAIPVITGPGAGSEQNQTFTISGTGGAAGATVEILKDLGGHTVIGTGPVKAGGSWDATVTDTLSPGPVSLVAEQFIGSTEHSGRSSPRLFKIRPPQLPLIEVSYPNETTVRLSGTAYNAVGADTKVHIHYKGNNPAPFPDVPVTNGRWTKDITGLLPSNTQYAFDVQQSVTDGSGGRIRNTGWTPALVTMTTPMPTLNTPTLSGQIPTFSGTRNVWESTRAGAIQIQLNDQTHTLLPDLQGSAVSWTLTATGKIAPGSYTVKARQGINSRWSEFKALAARLIIKPDLPEISSPAAGVETPQSVQFRGKTWPNAQVVVRFKNGDPIRTVTSNTTTGDWSFDYTLPLGRVEVQVLSTFGGQTSNVKDQSFPVKTPPPTITSPTPGNNEVPPKPVIEGTGIAGCSVHVYSVNTNAQLGKADVGLDKKWTVTLDEQNFGDLRIYTKQIFNTTFASNETAALLIKVVVPSPDIEQPGNNTRPARTFTVSGKGGLPGGVIDLKLNGQESTYTEIQVQNDGSWQVEVASAVGSLAIEAIQRYKGVSSRASTSRTVTVVPAVPVIDTPRNGEAVGGMLRISGFGYPGDAMHVQKTGSAHNFPPVTVNEDGTWSASFKHNMEAGNGIKVFARAGAGLDSAASSTITFLLLKPAPQINQPAEGDWVGVTPQYSGVAEPNATITVASWFDTDKLLAMPTEADNQGKWAVAGNQNLPVGAAWVVVRETLPDGTASEWAESGRFLVE